MIPSPGLSGLVISDFPSSNYASFYLTKRKSVKKSSDSSLKLISYSPIFASQFWIVVAVVILTVRDESEAFLTLFRLVKKSMNAKQGFGEFRDPPVL